MLTALILNSLPVSQVGLEGSYGPFRSPPGATPSHFCPGRGGSDGAGQAMGTHEALGFY